MTHLVFMKTSLHTNSSTHCFHTSTNHKTLKTDLVFVQFTVFVFFLSLFLKCDNHKTYKDVHHEESNDDDVDDEENGDLHTVVINRAEVFPVGVDGLVEQP